MTQLEAPVTGQRPQVGPSAFDDHHPPSPELIADCVHCGFCLPACPTYTLWGEEADSPRGRILLMDAASRGELELTQELVSHWDACLGCMACVDACPSGVQYDRLIEQTRQQVERRFRRPLRERASRAALFAALPHHRRLRVLGVMLAAYRATGAQRLVRRSGVLDRLPAGLRGLETAAPALRLRDLRARAPQRLAAAGDAPRVRVALLLGCVQRAFFGDVNAATARVLSGYGCEVLAPADQGCCGALEVHSGRERQALERARALIATLERTGADRIAVNSAGCGSVMKEYSDLLSDDAAWAERARRLSEKVRDVSELLAELGEPASGSTLHPLPMRLAYHDACHLAHAQGVTAQPRAVLGSISGVELVEITDGAICCGSAGIYNLVEPIPAAELGRRKAEAVRAAQPDALAAGNPGCLLQISSWLSRSSEPIPTFHPVELIDASLRGLDAATLLTDRHRLLASAGASFPVG